MADVTCPFTPPARPGWKPKSGELGSGSEGSGLHAPTGSRAAWKGSGLWQVGTRSVPWPPADPACHLRGLLCPPWYMDWSARPCPTAQWAADLPQSCSPFLGRISQPGSRSLYLALTDYRALGWGRGSRMKPDKVCLRGAISHANGGHGRGKENIATQCGS